MKKLNYLKTYESYLVNEKMFKEQIPWILELKPGDVIYAKEDYNEKDIDYARMSKSKIGKISKLNTINWIKHDKYPDDYTGKYLDYTNANKGDLIAIVLGDGEIRTSGGFVSNIKRIGKEDMMLITFNILLTNDKIEIKQYDIGNDEERKIFFQHNLNKPFNYKEYEIPLYNKKGYINFNYDKSSDILTVDEVYNKDGEQVASLRLKNASKNKDLTRDGKYL